MSFCVDRRRDDEEAVVGGEVAAARQRAAAVGVALRLPHHEVLRADEDAARPVGAARDRHQVVRRRVDRVGPLAHDVVEPEVELVEDDVLLVQHLVGLGVVLHLLAVDLEGREDRVVEADVGADDREAQRVRLVRLERRRDRQPRRRVAVEDVHELLLLDAADHHRAPARVGRHVLPGHDASAPRLPVRLGVHALELPLLRRELEDRNLARVGADHEVVAVAAGEAERAHRADDAKHLRRVHRLHLAVLVRAEQLEQLAARHDDLLALRRAEVAADCGRDRAAPLEREAVEVLLANCPLVQFPARPAGSPPAAPASASASARGVAASTRGILRE